jgi:chloramphenicol-sensitive protein RarD
VITNEESARFRVGITLGFSAYLVWGLLTLYWKALKDFDAFELIGWRIVTSTIILLATMLVTRRLFPLLKTLCNARLVARIGLASILLTINWTMYVWAVVNKHVLETALGYFIAPIFTIVVGVFVLREKLSTRQRVAVGFALSGITVLGVAYGRVPWIALVIASSWTVYGYLKKQIVLPPLESLTAEVMLLFIPAAIYVGATWQRADSVVSTANLRQFSLVLFTGVITAVPLLMFAGASQRTPLTIIGPMQYLVPTINFFIGWLMYNEEVTRAKLAGFVLIWICLAVVLFDLFSAQLRAKQPRQQLASNQR